MRYFTAPRIHDGVQFVSGKQVLGFEEDGIFHGFIEAGEVAADQVERFEGLLMPGLVNAHCHSELSHTKNTIPENTGLVPFLGLVVETRAAGEEEKNAAIEEALSALAHSGCIALGDIANSADSLPLRPAANMHIHTFVETMGFIPEFAVQRFDHALSIYQSFKAQPQPASGYTLRQSVAPHAPYSVSAALFALINSLETDSLLTIHNEESAAENEYFISKTGPMQDLYERLKINDAWFQPTGNNSLPGYLPYLSATHPLLLVHNTFMDEQDIDTLKASGREVSLCLCPNANWYIERRYPDVPLLAASGFNMCLGTDSLASNRQLNVYEEVLTLKRNFPEIPEERLLAWASSGGAKALRLDHIVGSFRPGLKPGLVHIREEQSVRIL